MTSNVRARRPEGVLRQGLNAGHPRVIGAVVVPPVGRCMRGRMFGYLSVTLDVIVGVLARVRFVLRPRWFGRPAGVGC